MAGSSRRALGSRAASPAGFGAFALLDGPGLTQFRVWGLGFRVWGLGFRVKALGFKPFWEARGPDGLT